MDSPVSAKAAILAVLTQGKGYGLDLIARVQEHTGGHVKLNEGSVYPALRAMEDEGLLRSFNGETVPSRGGRPRRYYKLTVAGLRAARNQSKAFKGLSLLLPVRS